VAQTVGSRGAAVVLVARSEEALAAVAGDIEAAGGQALAAPADVSDWAACMQVAEAALSRFGRIDALVNNAGVVRPLATTGSADPAEWRRCIEINLLGPFYMARATLEALRQSEGRVINISSGAATLPLAGAGAYCATKAGLNHFTAVLAAEEPRVTVLAVRPGVVDTDMQAELRSQAAGGMPADQVAYYRRLKAENRLEPPNVPGRAVAWLALHAPAEWSGHFISYDDPRIQA
jgi:NAD(P)-dependent dehydrogenase (short-subunit alcohol dehydrogenase family)